MKNDPITTQQPISCPPKGTAVWNLHPRVYLPAGKDKTAVCPYCSQVYKLQK